MWKAFKSLEQFILLISSSFIFGFIYSSVNLYEVFINALNKGVIPEYFFYIIIVIITVIFFMMTRSHLLPIFINKKKIDFYSSVWFFCSLFFSFLGCYVQIRIEVLSSVSYVNLSSPIDYKALILMLIGIENVFIIGYTTILTKFSKANYLGFHHKCNNLDYLLCKIDNNSAAYISLNEIEKVKTCIQELIHDIDNNISYENETYSVYINKRIKGNLSKLLIFLDRIIQNKNLEYFYQVFGMKKIQVSSLSEFQDCVRVIYLELGFSYDTSW